MSQETRQQELETFVQGTQQMQQLLSQYPAEIWNYKPTPDAWSITEVILHLTDLEANNYVRYRNVAIAPGSTVVGVDPDVWAAHLKYQKQNPQQALELFKLLRESNYNFLKSLPEDTWSNPFNHTERGPMVLEDLFKLQVNHVNTHIGQLREIYESWNAQNG